jgi:GT2 family glycosyltransferase
MRLLLLRSMLVSPDTYKRSKSSQTDSAYTVDWVQGSFLLIRADLWKRLNGLDESFFMYAEDVELCKRIQLSGSRCAYLPGFRYLHWGGFNVTRFPEQVCGLANYLDRHFNWVDRQLGRAILVCGCLFRAAMFGISGVLKKDVTRTKARASIEAFRRLISLDVRRVG